MVNGPESQEREICGYGFDMTSGEVTLKFGTFLDPHDIAVSSDAREVLEKIILKQRILKFKYLDLRW